jgi:A/G-specific adenine glycosylase
MPNVDKLLNWYDNNHRELPWRKTSDPYKIWLSEIILQQTRIEQGTKYYLAFLENFPTVRHLANAGEDQVMKLWQGLGYYTRARNLHATAKTIANELNGEFPDNYDDLLKLKGVGPYTAAAIASIVYNQPCPVIDGNVMRVVSRWFAIREAVNQQAGIKKIKIALDKLIHRGMPGKFNQAMMEFGATCCKPKNPDCKNCILNDQCLAYQQHLVAELPQKTPKAKIKTRFFYYIFLSVFQNEQVFTIIHKRAGNDIWKGLYEFPVIETQTEVSIEQLMEHADLRNLVAGTSPYLNSVSAKYTHQLTHQRINARFLRIHTHDTNFNLPSNYRLIPLDSLQNFAVPRLIEKYLEELDE